MIQRKNFPSLRKLCDNILFARRSSIQKLAEQLNYRSVRKQSERNYLIYNTTISRFNIDKCARPIYPRNFPSTQRKSRIKACSGNDRFNAFSKQSKSGQLFTAIVFFFADLSDCNLSTVTQRALYLEQITRK